jgi:hypothetical protein
VMRRDVDKARLLCRIDEAGAHQEVGQAFLPVSRLYAGYEKKRTDKSVCALQAVVACPL